MFATSTTIVPYNDMDEEIQYLCHLINIIPGIETVSSCFGHGKHPCLIWFKVDSIDTFSKFLFHFFNHESNWFIMADCGDPHRDATYLSFILQSGTISNEYDVKNMINDLETKFSNILSRRPINSNDFWNDIWR